MSAIVCHVRHDDVVDLAIAIWLMPRLLSKSTVGGGKVKAEPGFTGLMCNVLNWILGWNRALEESADWETVGNFLFAPHFCGTMFCHHLYRFWLTTICSVFTFLFWMIMFAVDCGWFQTPIVDDCVSFTNPYKPGLKSRRSGSELMGCALCWCNYRM